jgi:hypothetical protein
MKNLIGIAVIASMLFSCNAVDTTKSDSPSTENMKMELMQAQHETEMLKLKAELEVQKARQGAIDSMQSLAIGNNAIASTSATTRGSDGRTTQRVGNDGWTSGSTDAYRTTPTTQTTPVAVKKKKGMSTPVKGALIGAGVGAVTGAVVSKKKVKGAVVGAVVGAGAGAATGVIIDKRNEKKTRTPQYALTTF